jgi:hypothetical protein
VQRFMMALVGAVLVIAGAQVSAQAATIPLGDITDNTGEAFGGSLAFFTPQPVNDDITFTITNESFISGTLTNLVINVTLPFFGTFSILNISGLSATLVGPLTIDSNGNFSYAGVLAAGNYLINVTGTTTGILGGAYHIAVTAATTPIPGALLLFMTAMGGMAGVAGWRRRRAVAA